MMRENGASMGAGSSDRIVAADRIAIYSQDSAWEGIGYSGSTLKEYGCGLFTVHHAMQWVGIDPVTSPAAMAETDRKRGFYSNEASYFTRSVGTHGYFAEDLWSSCYELGAFRTRLIPLLFSHAACGPRVCTGLFYRQSLSALARQFYL